MTNPNQMSFDDDDYGELQPVDIVRIEGEPDTDDETWLRMIMKALRLARGKG